MLLGLRGGVLVVGVLVVGLGGGVLVVAVRWWGSCCWGQVVGYLMLGLGGGVLYVGVGGDILTDTPPVVWHRWWGTY